MRLQAFQLCLLLPSREEPLRDLTEPLPSPVPETGSTGRCVHVGAASVLCFPHVYAPLRELALLHGFCLDGQALGTDGQDHNENTHHKCHQGPEEAVQEDNLIMCAMQEHVIWSARRWK